MAGRKPTVAWIHVKEMICRVAEHMNVKVDAIKIKKEETHTKAMKKGYLVQFYNSGQRIGETVHMTEYMKVPEDSLYAIVMNLNDFEI